MRVELVKNDFSPIKLVLENKDELEVLYKLGLESISIPNHLEKAQGLEKSKSNAVLNTLSNSLKAEFEKLGGDKNDSQK